MSAHADKGGEAALNRVEKALPQANPNTEQYSLGTGPSARDIDRDIVRHLLEKGLIEVAHVTEEKIAVPHSRTVENVYHHVFRMTAAGRDAMKKSALPDGITSGVVARVLATQYAQATVKPETELTPAQQVEGFSVCSVEKGISISYQDNGRVPEMRRSERAQAALKQYQSVLEKAGIPVDFDLSGLALIVKGPASVPFHVATAHEVIQHVNNHFSANPDSKDAFTVEHQQPFKPGDKGNAYIRGPHIPNSGADDIGHKTHEVLVGLGVMKPDGKPRQDAKSGLTTQNYKADPAAAKQLAGLSRQDLHNRLGRPSA